MNVAMVHYHLVDGGVAEVIRRSCRALGAAGNRVVILTGNATILQADAFAVRLIPGLDYGSPSAGTAELLAAMRVAAREVLGCAPDVWHFHNHSLGKNPRLPEIVARLAADGERLLLHIHDLAEDGRPDNARMLGSRQRLYPLGPNVHYAFLNPRDRDRFLRAGLPGELAHLLPNPVEAARIPPSSSAVPLMLAPVRGIRRKNLGELILLASLAPPGSRVAVTRAPHNPTARRIHGMWQDFAAELDIPIDFAVVDRLSPAPEAGCSFGDWLAHSTHIVSTSVAEGFGLPFIEAQAWGRPLLGRKLPHPVHDPAAIGLASGSLYDRLLVPSEWIDEDALLHHLRRALKGLHEAWHRPLGADAADQLLRVMKQHEAYDFGNLPETLQRDVIHASVARGEASAVCVEIDGVRLSAAEWLVRALATRGVLPLSEEWPFTLTIYQKNLCAVYQELLDAPCAREAGPDWLVADVILADCLAPANFHFLAAPVAADVTTDVGFPFRAVIFDVYGTLLIAPAGGVKPDAAADPMLCELLRAHGFHPPQSPSTALHAAVLRHHQASNQPYPEVDLRELWRDILALPSEHDTTALVREIERVWHPAVLMPGADDVVRKLHAAGMPLGLLSNAQCDTLEALGNIAACFVPELTVLSYQHGMAKPSPTLFALMSDRLTALGIAPTETLFVGNDPLRDIMPAAAAGFRTALFTGHPDSMRPGDCAPDLVCTEWTQLLDPRSWKMHGESGSARSSLGHFR